MSEYERQRNARLERNLHVMASLGLVPSALEQPESAPSEQQQHPKEPVEAKKERYILPEELRRRSKRVADLPKPEYFPPPPSVAASRPKSAPAAQKQRKRLKRKQEEDDEEEDYAFAHPETSEEEEELELDDDEEASASSSSSEEEEEMHMRGNAKSNSNGVKRVSCHLLNAVIDPASVGQVFTPPAGVGAFKEHVILSIVESPGAERDAIVPVFNKYSGIQPFANCLVLFANVAAKRAPYDNCFIVQQQQQEGAQKEVISMDWYAAARTPQALLHRLSAQEKEEQINLFLRIEGEAYLCAGPVRITQREGTRYRLQFSDALLRTGDKDGDTGARDRLFRLIHYANASPPPSHMDKPV